MKELTTQEPLEFECIQPSLTDEENAELINKLTQMACSATGVPSELLKVNA